MSAATYQADLPLDKGQLIGKAVNTEDEDWDF